MIVRDRDVRTIKRIIYREERTALVVLVCVCLSLCVCVCVFEGKKREKGVKSNILSYSLSMSKNGTEDRVLTHNQTRGRRASQIIYLRAVRLWREREREREREKERKRKRENK